MVLINLKNVVISLLDWAKKRIIPSSVSQEYSMQPRQRLYTFVPWATTFVIILALGLGIFLYQYLKERYISAAGENLALLAAEMTDKLDLMLLERYGDIQVLARALQPLDAADMASSLYSMQFAYPLYSWIAVTDETGRIVAATDRTSLGEDRADTASFKITRKRGGIYLEDVHPAGPQSEPSIALTARVLSPQGDFRGVVTTRIRLQSFTEVLERTAQAYETRLRSGKLEHQIVAGNGVVIFASGAPTKPRVLATPSVLLSASGQSGYIEEQSVARHASVITGYAHTRSQEEFPTLQWSVLVRMDRSDVLAPVAALRWKLALLAAVVLPLVWFVLATTVRLRRDWMKTSEKNEWLSALLRSLGQGVIAVDPNGSLSFMNSLAESLTGWKIDEAKGRRLKDIFVLVDESTRQPLQDPIGRVLHEGRAITLGGPALLIAKDGTEKAVVPVGAPIKNPDGNVLGIALIFREVLSARRQQEGQAHESFEELSRSLLDKCQEITNPTQRPA
jgi:PAS domain S-box-containing protein